MIHNIKLIKKEQQRTSIWAGGTTTQLAIFPEEGSYSDRSFIWRLSSAVVELEKSDFTKLPGFERILMVLDGELELAHEGHHLIKLKQFEQDSFKGEWDTVSYGKARDFNLMLKEGISGSVKHYSMPHYDKLSIELKTEEGIKGYYALYSYNGAIKVKVQEKEFNVAEGDLLTFEWQGNESVSMIKPEGNKSDLITALIYM